MVRDASLNLDRLQRFIRTQLPNHCYIVGLGFLLSSRLTIACARSAASRSVCLRRCTTGAAVTASACTSARIIGVASATANPLNAVLGIKFLDFVCGQILLIAKLPVGNLQNLLRRCP